MLSSTSSSDLRPVRRPGAAVILLATALLVAIIAVLRPPSRAPANPDWFWRDKLAWRGEAAIVLAGDSRVYRGLVPDEFESRGLGRTLNFGFSSGAFDDPYLDAIERLVNPRVSQPLVVLGLSAWSLTPLASASNGFHQAVESAKSTPWSAQTSRRLARLADHLRPIKLGEWMPRPVTSDLYQQVFHPDGWVQSNHLRPDPARGLDVARENHLNGNHVDPVIVKNLAARIERWRARGWIVVATRIPGDPAVDHEAEILSAWTRSDVESTLVAAGALWLKISEEELVSYDGVHLDAASAHRISASLAISIRQTRAPLPAHSSE